MTNDYPDLQVSCKRNPSTRKSLAGSIGSAISLTANFIFTALICTVLTTLMVVSAAYNGYFGYTQGEGISVYFAWLAVGAAVAIDITKAVAFSKVGTDRKRWAAWLVFACLATCVSLTAAFSLKSMARGDLVAERQANKQASIKAEATYQAAIENRNLAKTQLASIDTASMRKELRELVGTKGLACDAPTTSQQYGPISRRTCPQIEVLKDQLASAKQLQAIIQTQIAAPEKRETAVGESDPASASVASALGGFGWKVEPHNIAPWIVLVWVLTVEFGSASAMSFARSVSGADARTLIVATTPDMKDVTPDTANQTTLSAPQDNPDTRKDAGVSDHADDNGPDNGLGGTAKQRVLSFVKINGGSVQGGQREIAAKIGVSKSRLGEVVKALADAGALIVEPDRRNGTRLALA